MYTKLLYLANVIMYWGQKVKGHDQMKCDQKGGAYGLIADSQVLLHFKFCVDCFNNICVYFV